MKAKFPWGEVIEVFVYDFDGRNFYATKYRDKDGGVYYHVEELHASYENIESAVIAWIAYKKRGLNQHALVAGVCRALECA